MQLPPKFRLHRDAPADTAALMMMFMQKLSEWPDDAGDLVTFGAGFTWVVYRCRECGELHYAPMERDRS